MTILDLVQKASRETNLAAALSALDELLHIEIAGANEVDEDAAMPPIDRDAVIDRMLQLDADEPWWTPLDGLRLAAIERLLVLLALAPETSLHFEQIFLALNREAGQHRPTVDLAMRIYGRDEPTALQVRSRLDPS